MEPAEIALRVVGLFYAFAGYAGTRAMLTSRFFDQAIAAISMKKTSRTETARTNWLLCASGLILVGGVALMLLLDFSAWLFVLSALGQVIYLFYAAPVYFDAEDPPDAAGRKQSTNAFVLYVAATAFVIWAWFTGKLVPWQDVPWPALAVAAAGLIAHAVYVLRLLGKPLKPGGGFSALDIGDDDSMEIEKARAQAKRVKLMAEFYAHPLWALEDGLDGDFPPDLLGISPELVSDLAAWSEAYMAAKKPDSAFEVVWSDEELRAHELEGRQLAARLKRERPDLMVYNQERATGVIEIHADDPV
jgi:hypothetical protein